MHRRIRVYVSLLLTFAFASPSLPLALGQNTSPPQNPQQDEVLRISSDLTQTDVMVIDKQGRAVTGLAREQFELLVDGQPQPILFFEGVEAGGAREAAKLAASRSGGSASGSTSSPSATMLSPLGQTGRSFIFFVDDLHLSQASVRRTQQLLSKFIDGMGLDDQAMILSPSGSIGFLQQLTGNKAVLRIAASRIKFQPQSVAASGRRAMTPSEAQAIDRGQRDVLDYKVKEVMDDMGLVRTQSSTSGNEIPGSATPPPSPSGTPGSGGQSQDRSGGIRGMTGTNTSANAGGPDMVGTNLASRKQQAEMYVKSEAQRVLQHSNAVSGALLSSLEVVARGSASLPGRKLVFFISDGFIIDTRNSSTGERLNRVVDAAARSGVAVYTFDSKGLTADFADAGTDAFSDTQDLTGGQDPSVSATSVAINSSRENKEVLRMLAEDTGGRAILNKNDLESGLRQIVNETASYYILAWKPQAVDAGKPVFKTIKVGVKDRPDLRVFSRRGFFTAPPQPLPDEGRAAATKNADKKSDKSGGSAAASKPGEEELRVALTSPFPKRQINVVTYSALANEPSGGAKVTALADLSGYMAAPGADGKSVGEVDFVAVVLDDKGKSVSSVGQRVNAPSDEGGAKPFRITAKMPNTLLPGLYQVRVAARDAKTGRIGSAFQWVEVPDLKPGKMTLSSIMLAEAPSGDGKGAVLEVSRSFARASHMLVQFLAYNAARTPAGQPDVVVTLKVLQGGKTLISSPPQPLPASGDPSRLEYSAGFPLANFPPGRYLLQIDVEDRAGKTTKTEQFDFVVE